MLSQTERQLTQQNERVDKNKNKEYYLILFNSTTDKLYKIALLCYASTKWRDKPNEPKPELNAALFSLIESAEDIVNFYGFWKNFIKSDSISFPNAFKKSIRKAFGKLTDDDIKKSLDRDREVFNTSLGHVIRLVHPKPADAARSTLYSTAVENSKIKVT